MTSGRIDGEINKVAHGGLGGSLEGMINLPVADNIAFRAVSAFYQHDAGYIDNVFGSRTYCGISTTAPIPMIPRTITVGCIRDGSHRQCRRREEFQRSRKSMAAAPR